MRLTLAPAEAAPGVAELNVPGAFRGRVIEAESIGQSGDDLMRRRVYPKIVGGTVIARSPSAGSG